MGFDQAVDIKWVVGFDRAVDSTWLDFGFWIQIGWFGLVWWWCGDGVVIDDDGGRGYRGYGLLMWVCVVVAMAVVGRGQWAWWCRVCLVIF